MIGVRGRQNGREKHSRKREVLSPGFAPSAGSETGEGFQANSERGNALIEFLLCFPFVLTVFMFSIDLGRALNTYFTITRIVYEGTRYAGQVGTLEVQDCRTLTQATPFPGHMLVRSRIDTLLIRYNINPGTLTPDYLRTRRIAKDITIINDRDRVFVSLSIPFEPIFPLVGELFKDPTDPDPNKVPRLSANSTGPYLYL